MSATAALRGRLGVAVRQLWTSGAARYSDVSGVASSTGWPSPGGRSPLSGWRIVATNDAALSEVRTPSSSARYGTASSSGREGYTGDYETVDVEFCVLCDYQPRFELLASRIEGAHPGRFTIRANPLGQPRNGAFEVTWRRPGVARKELWSKLETGEPSCVEAVEGVAELVNKELSQLS